MNRIKLGKQIVLLALAACVLSACGCQHETVTDKAVAATCTEDGLTEGKHCTLCDKVLVKDDVVAAKGHNEVVTPGKEATCTKSGLTEGSYCSTCGKVFAEQKTIDPLGHSTTTGKCSRCGQDVGEWKIAYYYDEFNQPTKDAYVTNTEYCSGTFSNSATTNSALSAMFIVDKENISIMLFEYERYQVKNAYSQWSEFYNITMKTPDGKKTKLEAEMFSGDDRMYICDWDNYKEDLLKALKSGGSVSFYIEEADSGMSTYLFSVNSSNFAELYKKIK